MGVAIHTGALTPHGELLRALSRARQGSVHEFILCHELEGEHIAKSCPEFHSISLSRENMELAGQQDRALNSLSFAQRLRSTSSGAHGFPAALRAKLGVANGSTWFAPPVSGRRKAISSRPCWLPV
jgi:hypothetical protein